MKIFLFLLVVGLLSFGYQLYEAIESWHETTKDSEYEK